MPADPNWLWGGGRSTPMPRLEKCRAVGGWCPKTGGGSGRNGPRVPPPSRAGSPSSKDYAGKPGRVGTSWKSHNDGKPDDRHPIPQAVLPQGDTCLPPGRHRAGAVSLAAPTGAGVCPPPAPDNRERCGPGSGTTAAPRYLATGPGSAGANRT